MQKEKVSKDPRDRAIEERVAKIKEMEKEGRLDPELVNPKSVGELHRQIGKLRGDREAHD